MSTSLHKRFRFQQQNTFEHKLKLGQASLFLTLSLQSDFNISQSDWFLKESCEITYAEYRIQAHKELVNISEECKQHLLTWESDTTYVYRHGGSEELSKRSKCLTIIGLLP